MKDVAISLYFVKWTHLKDFLGQQSSHSLFVRDLWIQNFQFIINLELQGHLDDYLRYINTSDVLGDCYPARAARAG